MKKILLLTILFSTNLFASEQTYQINDETYIYQTPKFFDFVTTMPKNYLNFIQNSFTKDTLTGWGVIAASTTLLLAYDRQILNETKHFGRKIGVGNGDGTKALVSLGGISVFRGPTDVGSAFYFLGDGWTTLILTGSFYGVGMYSNDNRALQTSSQLLQGLLLTGVTTQALKRMTGRESPSRATTPTGKWRPFPSLSNYQKHGATYNAFPSGHLATLTASVTIVAENYAEYKFIKPLGYSLMGLLSLEMMNNNVHWASDYPLAIGIGYVLGKTIAHNGRKKISPDKTEKISYELVPIISDEGVPGMAMNWNY